ncbi:glycosyltransferase family 2 protein [Candidatus Symbiobacter mobilis]|uniref:Cell wall biogenesis glycosyltransferase n=1 Tax=Candidatus Symbiobacter mobilis CR TaxID=946483 RepID=U5N8N4_9BURK|nr:glycosyltransferase family 2 protein [Candidatus Symbiobacter mobilis]AGX86544.1 cell wall biogenesis glycosyltransferase [Candidatus Symbiobacter mobilis CR]
MKLSAIIITHNEQANIGECIRCLDFVDEVVVLDHGSTDDTVHIARSLGARVHTTDDWPGFGPQKNRVLDLAQGQWILSIDADERVTPELRQEILRSIACDTADCFALPRLSWFCGKFIRHSGWAPDLVDRLFKAGTARFSNDLVHEKLLPQGPSHRLSTPLLHFSYRDFSDVLRKIDRYSTASSAQAYARGKRASVLGAMGHGLWAFLRTFFLQAGFLDGEHGLVLAIARAQGSYYNHLKLWRLCQTNGESITAIDPVIHKDGL